MDEQLITLLTTFLNAGNDLLALKCAKLRLEIAALQRDAPVVPVKPAAYPVVPFACTGNATWWGQDPDGSNDEGDVDASGKDMLGAFGDDNHNKVIVGASIPIVMFQKTIGDSKRYDVKLRKYTLDVLSHSTGKHISGVWLTDLGPNARLKRPLDLTWKSNTLLGHTTGTNLCTFWITGPGGIMEIKGWDFANGMVVA